MARESRPAAVEPMSYSAMRRRVDSGTSSLTEELSALLDRTERFEPVIHALLPDESAADRRKRVLTEARALEERYPAAERRPSLFGALIGIKDLFHAAGFPTRAGSQLPAEVFAGSDAPGAPSPEIGEASTVAALREAGAIVLGKTVSTEFAYFAPGATRNPWNTDSTPGGSSSGSAAAVAAGMCHAALGTQTAGSISRPASYCGVAGFKPSYGRIAGDGVFPFSPDADHVGPIAGDVEGLHSLATVLIPDQSPSDDLTAVARPAERLALSRRSRKAGGTAADLDAGVAGGLTVKRALGAVLIPDDEYLAQADASGAEALRAAAERLHSLGVTVQRVRVFEDLAALNEMHFDMIAADFAEVHAPLIDRYGELYRRPSLELAERGAGVSSRRRESARAGRAALRDELDRTLDIHGAGLWISPAAVGEAPHGLDSTGSPVMNIPWTYAGVPTVAVPATRLGGGVGPRRLPLGVQAAGRFNADESLLSLAALVELVLS